MDFTTIQVPACMNCEGILKPDFVFFGGTVDKLIVQFIYDAISTADASLIVGTSLNVFLDIGFVNVRRKSPNQSRASIQEKLEVTICLPSKSRQIVA
jgi:NAD-dependent SIR2 family protein deacetylase